MIMFVFHFWLDLHITKQIRYMLMIIWISSRKITSLASASPMPSKGNEETSQTEALEEATESVQLKCPKSPSKSGKVKKSFTNQCFQDKLHNPEIFGGWTSQSRNDLFNQTWCSSFHHQSMPAMKLIILLYEVNLNITFLIHYFYAPCKWRAPGQGEGQWRQQQPTQCLSRWSPSAECTSCTQYLRK